MCSGPSCVLERGQGSDNNENNTKILIGPFVRARINRHAAVLGEMAEGTWSSTYLCVHTLRHTTVFSYLLYFCRLLFKAQELLAEHLGKNFDQSPV